MTTAIATILPPGRTQFINGNGAPVIGGSVYFYIPGSTTLKNTWQDALQTTLNTNPVVLDGVGSALIYGNGQYAMAVYDASGNLQYTALTQDFLGQNNTFSGDNTFSGVNNFSGVTSFTNTNPATFKGAVQVQNAGYIRSGAGSPNGVVSGANGDIFLRTDGTAGARLYVCSGTTVWSAIAITQDFLGQNNTFSGVNNFSGVTSFTNTNPTTFKGAVQVQNGGYIRSGTGSPNGVVSGANGDIFLRTDGTAGARLYVCSGTTVWAAVATV